MLTLEIESPEQVTANRAATDRRSAFEKLPVVSHVEFDKACRICGHNLRTQPIRRDPRTQILVCRCPQCARFHPAPEKPAPAPPPWTKFLARSLMYLWLLIVAGGGVTMAAGQGVCTLLTLELLTTHQNVPAQVARTPGYRGPAYRYVLKRDFREYQFLTGVAVAGSMLIVLAGSIVASVVFYHWSKIGMAAFCLLEPAAIGFAACLVWKAAAPELLTWGAAIIGLHVVAQIVAAAIGVLIGRPLVRILICVAVPTHLRSILSHLWHADGQDVPAAAGCPR